MRCARPFPERSPVRHFLLGRTLFVWLGAAALPYAHTSPAHGHQLCVGDCNADGAVTIDEIVRGVDIALGNSRVIGCPAFDPDNSDTVSVAELVAAVYAALTACPPLPPSPTPTTNSTPTHTCTAGFNPPPGCQHEGPTFTPTVTATPERGSTATPTPSVFWESLAPLPQRRQEVGVAELDGRIYVVGGFNDAGQVVDTVESYDPSTDAWLTAAPLPRPLHHVTAAAVGGRLYAIGGLRTLAFTAVGSLYAYDPATDAWQSRATLPRARGAAAAAVIDGLIYVAGGLRGVSIADFAVYSPGSNSWTVLDPVPTARDHLGAAAINGTFYAVGGRAGGHLFNVLEAYDPLSASWTTRQPMPTARGGLAVAALGGHLFTFGGEGNPQNPLGTFPQTETYDPSTNRWEMLPDMPTPRHGTAAAAYGDRIFVPGGATLQGFGASAANEALRP